MQIRYTKHAIIEMYAQGIHVSKIEDTLINGEKKLESKRQKKYRSVRQYGNEKIHVVFRIANDQTILVITCKRVKV